MKRRSRFAEITGHVGVKYALTAKNIGKDKLLWGIYLVSAAITVITQSESVWLFLGAGVLVWLIKAPPRRWFSGGSVNGFAALAMPMATGAVDTAINWPQLAQIGAFFAKAGASFLAVAWRLCRFYIAVW